MPGNGCKVIDPKLIYEKQFPLYVWTFFFNNVHMILSSECPAARCLSCSTLYSTKFDRKVEEGERIGAIEEKEYLESDEVTSVEKSYSKERKLLSRTKIRGYIVNY